jgi:iron-sulfur cluster assembly accessory protein
MHIIIVGLAQILTLHLYRIFESPADNESAQVLIDAISYPYLANAEIDFTEELIGSAFKIANNPNASTECGCKISFQAK